MKICIVTVYNSENCGSFLQAYALSEQLKTMGHDVYFLERTVKGTSHSIASVLTECAKSVLRLKIKNVGMILSRHSAFSRAESAFRVVPNTSKALEKIDLIILGSDTIWNFKESYFAKYAKRYTGEMFSAKPFAFYAASCANTTLEDIAQQGINMNSVSLAKAVSVRDAATADLIETLIDRKATLVCDPTLLVDKGVYDKFSASKTVDGKYLLVYCFGAIGEKYVNGIRSYAKNRNLKIVNIGTYQAWADICLPATPDIFVSYYRDAECVVTNTFHGTIFSTIFEKQFVVITDQKKKIMGYLSQIQLEDRMISDGALLGKVLDTPVDQNELAKEMETIRQKSVEFLKNATE